MTRETEAAKVVAKAAEVAADTAERVAEAAAAKIALAVKDAAHAVSLIAQSQATIASSANEVAKERLNAMEKRYDKHEDLDRQMFSDITENQDKLKEELQGDIKDIALDLKKQTRVITLMTGGIIAISRVPDLIALFHH